MCVIANSLLSKASVTTTHIEIYGDLMGILFFFEPIEFIFGHQVFSIMKNLALSKAGPSN